MYFPDNDTRRQLARERQAELRRDWHLANPARPEVVESRRRLRWRLQLRRLWIRFHPASHLSWRPRT